MGLLCTYPPHTSSTPHLQQGQSCVIFWLCVTSGMCPLQMFCPANRPQQQILLPPYSILLMSPHAPMSLYPLPDVCLSSVIQGSIWMSNSFTELPALSQCGKMIFSIYLGTGVALSGNCTPMCSSNSMNMGGTPRQDPFDDFFSLLT